MPSVRGCNIPDDLLYDVDNHIWFQEQGDGNVKLGMTTVATAMAGKLVAYTPKKVGRSVQPGKSCGTLESGKWVGPAKSAAGGEVVAVNEALGNQGAEHASGDVIVVERGDFVEPAAARLVHAFLDGAVEKLFFVSEGHWS